MLTGGGTRWEEPHPARLGVLDGWRAISILLVLATHMLPLGPKWMRLNEAAGPAGMSLFFTLSGYLITSTLLRNPGVAGFLIRRLFRIVPLALAGSSVILLIQGAPFRAYPPLWLYFANYAGSVEGVERVSHFWSLCVEMHFYVFVGLLVAAMGRRGLAFLPVVGLGVTVWRMAEGATLSVATHLRVDEILAGAALALCVSGGLGVAGARVKWALGRAPLLVLACLFAWSCHPGSGWLQYARPYLGAATVGATLGGHGWYTPVLASRPLAYIAEVSYALYVIHPASMMGWLGTGDTAARYLKRPLCLLITFGVAHLSTFYFERPLTEWGKRLAGGVSSRSGGGAGPAAGPVKADTAA